MRKADNSRLNHAFVFVQRGFDLCGTDPVTGYVDHIIHPASDPVIAVFVTPAAVAGKIKPLVGGKIGLDKPRVVAIHAAGLTGPAIGDDKVAGCRPFQKLTFLVHQRGLDTKHRPCRRTGLEHGGARQGRDHHAAGLGLPPCIHNGATFLADHTVIPEPSFGVDRLPHRSQKPDRAAVMLFDRLVAEAFQRADRCGGGIEDIDLVFFAHLPEPASIRIGGHPFKHEGSGTVGQRTVHNIAVAGDPAHICGAPVNLARLVIKDIFVGHGCPDHIAAGGMQHAFRRAGGARGIKDKQRVLGLHFLRWTVSSHLFSRLVIPDVTVLLPGYVAARTAHHNNTFYIRALSKRVVDIGLERHTLRPTQAFISRNHQGRGTVLDTSGKGVG